jgi:hypothetical protein
MNSPLFFTVQYTLNEVTGYYDLISCPPGFNKTPNELLIEETWNKGQIKSNMVLRGRIEAGKYKYFTGLLPIKENWYFGDHYLITAKGKQNSLNLFHFTPDSKSFSLMYFPGFKLYPSQRGIFFTQFFLKHGSKK